MTQNLSVLNKAAGKLLSSEVTVLAHVDYGNGDPTGQMFELAVKKAFKSMPIPSSVVDVVNTRVGLYQVHQCAYILAQFAFAPNHIRPERGVHLVNVAKIDGAKNGVRRDKIFLAVTTLDEIILGFTAPGDPILDVVFPHLRAIYEAELPDSFLQGKHFRGRDVLPPLLRGVIIKDSNFTDHIHRVPFQDAREHFEIGEVDKSRAWYADSFNGPGNNEYNLKTAHTVCDLDTTALIKSHNHVNVRFGDREIGRAVVTNCLQNIPDGKLAVALGSSSICFPDQEPIRFLDIMVKGGNANEHLGHPRYGEQLHITAAEPDQEYEHEPSCLAHAEFGSEEASSSERFDNASVVAT